MTLSLNRHRLNSQAKPNNSLTNGNDNTEPQNKQQTF